MTETSAVNEDVLDAVAELTNMIIGSVKTDLKHISALGAEHSDGRLGRNFKTRSAGSTEG